MDVAHLERALQPVAQGIAVAQPGMNQDSCA
jgi:hypothetical protein